MAHETVDDLLLPWDPLDISQNSTFIKLKQEAFPIDKDRNMTDLLNDSFILFFVYEGKTILILEDNINVNLYVSLNGKQFSKESNFLGKCQVSFLKHY